MSTTPSGLVAPRAAPRIVAAGLSRHFRRPDGTRLDVLDRIDLQVEPGEFVALLGPSGCGKTTLLDIVAGLAAASAGTVHVDGRSDRLGLTGYLTQRDLLMPWKDVLDNVALALRVQGVGRRAARARASEQLARFGLDDTAGRSPSELSGGMRQRVAFARTMLGARRCLLLDEPFGALDALTRLDMQTWLQTYCLEHRPTVLLVTHDVDEALRLADRIVLLGHAPARIALERQIVAPRPRDIHAARDDVSTRLRATLLEHLLQPSRTSFDAAPR